MPVTRSLPWLLTSALAGAMAIGPCARDARAVDVVATLGSATSWAVLGAETLKLELALAPGSFGHGVPTIGGPACTRKARLELSSSDDLTATAARGVAVSGRALRTHVPVVAGDLVTGGGVVSGDVDVRGQMDTSGGDARLAACGMGLADAASASATFAALRRRTPSRPFVSAVSGNGSPRRRPSRSTPAAVP